MITKIIDRYITKKIILRIREEIGMVNDLKIEVKYEDKFCNLYVNYTDERELKEERFIYRWKICDSIYKLIDFNKFSEIIEYRIKKYMLGIK